MVDSDVGAAVTATDEAILLYLQALNTDLADRALALKLMVEIQMQAGEFDKALDSARQATRTARGLSASLRERLADTRRDIGPSIGMPRCRAGSRVSATDSPAD